MTYTYNLLDEQWIPCIDSDGHVVDLSLRETLVRADHLHELDGESPLVTAALYRLLLAVLHRVHGPATWDDWTDLWERRAFDAVPLDAYLGRWRERFDLFHPERPFYQVAEMESRFKPKSVASLVFDAASGNNATLFDHTTAAEGLTLAPGEAARGLLAAQAFGLAGLCMPGLSFTDGPWARGIVFLVQGSNLFETLLLNLIRYDSDNPMPLQPGDRPAWEMDDPFDLERQIPHGYLDYLTWQNRRVRFLPESGAAGPRVQSMLLGPGLRLTPGVLDPQKHFRRDEKRGPQPLRFKEDRALWRDSAALFSISSSEYILPRAFNWLAELVEDGALGGLRTRRVLALGLSCERGKAAKVEFFRLERLPLPGAYLETPSLVETLAQLLEMAEAASRKLWGAAKTMATFSICPGVDSVDVTGPDKKDVEKLVKHWDIERRYWAVLEAPFRLTLESLVATPAVALTAWSATLHRAAWAAFESTASNFDAQPRSLKAAVRGRDQLAMGLAKVFPRNT